MVCRKLQIADRRNPHALHVLAHDANNLILTHKSLEPGDGGSVGGIDVVVNGGPKRLGDLGFVEVADVEEDLKSG